MFTGIIGEIGIIKSVRSGQLTIEGKRSLEGTSLGDSIAVNGGCLTVTRIDGAAFSVDVMPETLRRTNLGKLHPGDAVNLEQSLAAGGHIGGHFVQGHVDAIGKVISLVPEDEAILVRYTAPAELMRYIVEKGFIAIDGVSLTVADFNATSFRVSLVAYTQQNTNLAHRKPGDEVNLEVDIIAKYVERLRKGSDSVITFEFLAEHGFLRQ